MRKHPYICIFLTFCMLFSFAACGKRLNSYSSKKAADRIIEIVYKRGQMCYAIDPDDESLPLYVFSAAGQPVYDAEDKASTGSTLLPGMMVSVEYDGYIIETYPLQFSGISKISVQDSKANNVEFLVSQISGMFPSTKPSDMMNWEIVFSGDSLLTAGEKRALEFILKENWSGTSITVEPQQDDADIGKIQVEFSNVKADSMDVHIIVNDGGEVQEKNLHPVLQGSTWTIE